MEKEKNKEFGQKKDQSLISKIKLVIKVIGIILMILIVFLMLSALLFMSFPGSLTHNNPINAAKDILVDAYNSPGSIQVEGKVTFNSAEANINSISIANMSKLGLKSEQVCLSLGLYAGSQIFTINDERSSLSYTGSGAKDAGLVAFCYTGSEIESALLDISYPFNSEWAYDCPCVQSQTEDICCVVALTTPKS